MDKIFATILLDLKLLEDQVLYQELSDLQDSKILDIIPGKYIFGDVYSTIQISIESDQLLFLKLKHAALSDRMMISGISDELKNKYRA